MYFDTHTHLNSEELFNERDKYIQNAINEGVTHMIVVGYDLPSSRKAIQIANEYDFLYAVVGVGPNDCKDLSIEDLDTIRELGKESKVVAIGEIGLDYYWDNVSKEKQFEVFRKQIQIAKELNKPIVIHSRDAINDTYQILEETKHYGIMHCFSGSVEMAKRFTNINYMISLAGPVTFKNALTPKSVAKEINLEYLLIETDCPYLTPVPFRGKLNEPKNVQYVAKEIAALKKVSEEEVAKITTFNAFKVFGIK